MKRVLIACIFLLLLILGCAGETYAIQRTAFQAADEISQVSILVETQNFNAALDHLQNSYHFWSEKCALLSTLIDHTILDEIETLYRRAMRYVYTADSSNTLSELAALSSALEQLGESERLSAENIF